MIAAFPEFSPVTTASVREIAELAPGFEQYAGFNPVSLCCWNREYPGGLSVLYENLVVKWKDPTGGIPFLTFAARGAFRQTARTLLDYAHHHYLSSCLRAVPATDHEALSGNDIDDEFSVCRDRDNYEYVLSVDDWSHMRGGEFRNQRNVIHRLERRWPISVRPLSLEDEQVQVEMIRLSHRWAQQRGATSEQFRPELTALHNLFDYVPATRVFALGAFVDDQLVGFSVNDYVANGIGIGHFAKADYTLSGLYTYLLHHVCIYLQGNGVKTLNIEEDLGEPGLRQAKLLLKPMTLLEKVMICPK